MTVDLMPGANLALPSGAVVVAVGGPYDVSALVLGENGRVDGDADFVFFNQPTAPGVRVDGATVTVEPARLRRGADRVVLLVSPADAAVPFGRLPVPAASVTAGSRAIARFGPRRLTTETVLQLVEFYRRNGGWKLRAIGQGFDDGLAGLARDFGVQVDDDGQSAPVAAARAPVNGAGSMVDAVVAGTNAERAAHGMPALTVDRRLAAAARAHSADMVARGFFAHESPDGRSVADRVTREGYPYRVVAENIAAGQRTAAEVVDGWMHSPGHRANILSPDVRQIGVAHAAGGGYGIYWTQVFGTPR